LERENFMPSHELLKLLTADALWEYLKWLAFGQGRYVGIHLDPCVSVGEGHDRLQRLAERLLRAVKQPDDAALGVTPPALDFVAGDAALVVAVAEYVAARHIALYRDAADFEPSHALKIQEDALDRIKARLGLSHL
jgi:hypothetical protein